MLVLTGKLDEETKIMLGDNLAANIKILSINRGKVRIGIEAPPEVKILRKEAKKLK